MSLIQVNFFSQSLLREVDFTAILPIGAPFEQKGAKAKPYKTLYLLHGLFGDRNDWVNNTRIKLWAMERNLAVILPSGENKFYLNMPKTGEAFSDYIGKELVEVTRRLFPLSKKREDTFIAGLSMGGYGAIINGLTHHKTFGYVAGLSSALVLDRVALSTNEAALPVFRRDYYEAVFGNLDSLAKSEKNPEFLVKSLARKKVSLPELYLCCGREDGLITQNRAFHRMLNKEGIAHKYQESPGAHDWDYWDTHIKKVLDWLPLDPIQKEAE